MSRKHRRDKVRHTPVHSPEVSGGLIATFAEKKNLDLRNTNDLMNWLVFGEEKKMYNIATNLT